jgi:hypothetical protein
MLDLFEVCALIAQAGHFVLASQFTAVFEPLTENALLQ